MYTRFIASQTLELTVPDQPIPIQHYLRQPKRLVYALTDPTRLEQISPEVYRLKIRPLSFMMLKLQPIVDIKVWSEADGTIHLKSVNCEMRGIEYLNKRFVLHLVGHLYPTHIHHKTYLIGRADLEVKVELPPPISLTPTAIIQTTGNTLLNSVLLTIKQRLMHQLLLDYHQWAKSENKAKIPVGSILSVNKQII